MSHSLSNKLKQRISKRELLALLLGMTFLGITIFLGVAAFFWEDSGIPNALATFFVIGVPLIFAVLSGLTVGLITRTRQIEIIASVFVVLWLVYGVIMVIISTTISGYFILIVFLIVPSSAFLFLIAEACKYIRQRSERTINNKEQNLVETV